MPRGRKQTDDKTIRECILLYAELQSYSEVGRRLNLAPNTVKKIVNNEELLQKHSDLMQKYEEVKKQETNDLIELVKSVKYSNIANNIVDMFDRDNLEQERNTNGIRNLISLLGNTIDKTIKIKELEIKQQQLELSIRQLALREKELDARLDSGETFANVQIVNDAPIRDDSYGAN
jgi:sulfatase maturation enzyme AslB (radical SAM superfamily)